MTKTLNKGKLLTCALLFTFISSQQLSGENPVDSTSNNNALSIIGVGDIMLGTNFPSPKYLPPDAMALLNPVNEELQDADVTFGNLEGALLDSGQLVKNCEDTTKCYAFRMPTSYIHPINCAGIDLMSLANNHSGDFGRKGRLSTIETLRSGGIHAAGLTSKPAVIFERKNLKIGMAAFSPNNGTPQITDLERARELISNLTKVCDVVIASFHGGAEGAENQNVPRETEQYYGENRGNVYKFAHTLIDNGADVIFGHGPHVPRALELYRNRIIAYSLGNFATYARFNVTGVNGLAPILKVWVDQRGQFKKGKLISAIQKGEGGPVLDPQNRAAKKIKELTQADFPQSLIQITEEGLISIDQKND